MRAAASILTGLVLAAGAVLVKAHTPDDYDHRFAPLVSSGHAGAPVRAGEFEVKVESVGVARSVTSEDRKIIRPDGVFVIVTVTARSRHRPLSLWAPLLRTRDGREFAKSDKAVTTPVDGTLDNVTLGPELWRHGVLVFEIPANLLAGSALELAEHSLEENDPPQGFPAFGFELSAQANISLGIDGDRARRLVAQAPDAVTVHGTTP